MSVFNYHDNQLHAEDFPLEDIAEQFGTPCYVYSRAALTRMGTRIAMDQDVREKRELDFLDNMRGVEESAIAGNPELPMSLPDAQVWQDLSRRRLGAQGDGNSRMSAAEQEISKKLSSEVNIKFSNRPLGAVLDDLAAMANIPIVIDERALTAVRVTPETPITLQLQNSIPLKSALNIILDKMELTHVIDNDVLTITSMQAKQAKVYPETYRVTDLVTPIPNFTSSYEDGLAGALRAAYQMSSPQTDVHVMPVSMTDLAPEWPAACRPRRWVRTCLANTIRWGHKVVSVLTIRRGRWCRRRLRVAVPSPTSNR